MNLKGIPERIPPEHLVDGFVHMGIDLNVANVTKMEFTIKGVFIEVDAVNKDRNVILDGEKIVGHRIFVPIEGD